MLDHYHPEFNNFYMGRCEDSMYVDTIGMSKVEYPSKSDFIRYMVVVVDSDDNSKVSRFKNEQEVRAAFPEASENRLVDDLLKTRRLKSQSFRTDSKDWANITVDIDEDEYKEAKKAYEVFQGKLSDHFDEYLKKEILSNYLIPRNQEMFSAIYSKAYDAGHSSGYGSVASEFQELCEFVSSILMISETSTES